MSDLKIFVWKNREGVGEPEVEVKVPVRLARWIPRMMRFVPKKTMEENWGQDVDFDKLFSELDALVKEAVEGGHPEILDVKTKDTHVKILVEG